MKFVKNLASSLFIITLLIGCTITPKQVESNSASYDGGEKNSGFIGWTTNNSICYGVITFHAKDRYNSLIKIYGKRFEPPLKENYGIILDGRTTSTNYYITLEGLSKFSEMNRWRKNNQ